MASRKGQLLSELGKDECEVYAQAVYEMSLQLADKKEKMQWMRLLLEKRDRMAREMRDRLRALQVVVLGIEDREERASVMVENLRLQKDMDDRLFTLALVRSDARRVMHEVSELEERIVAIKKTLGGV